MRLGVLGGAFDPMRIGVFGGTFDPIHLGHLIVAETVREAERLDRVVFVPAGQPWHRDRAPLASPADRLAMVRLAVAGNPDFAVSTVDVDRAGPTYTVDTLAALRAETGADLLFLLGQDALAQIGEWHEPARIADLAEIVALTRPGAPPFDPAGLPIPAHRLRLVETPLIGISATLIRARVAAGRSIRYLTPEPVAAYIATHRLYRR